MNFHAIQYGVSESIGIDVDEKIVQVGIDRLAKIHPPPNLQFHVSDLMDPNSVAWKKQKDEQDSVDTEINGNNKTTDDSHIGGLVSRATILTMYFATPGLERIRPLLEQALVGKRCKIFTCGYPMPGWNSQFVETVLDIPIHIYDWGTDDNAFFHDSLIETFPVDNNKDKTADMFGMNNSNDRFLNQSKKKSTFKPEPLKGFHSDDLIDNIWDDFDEDDDGDDDGKDDEQSAKPARTPLG